MVAVEVPNRDNLLLFFPRITRSRKYFIVYRHCENVGFGEEDFFFLNFVRTRFVGLRIRITNRVQK